MQLHQSTPFQPMPPHAAVGYHNSYVAPGARVPFVNSFSHCQSNVPVVRMPLANINPVNNMHSVPANMQNPFAAPPVVRNELPLPMRPHLMNYDMQAQQQLFQQQLLFQLAAAAGNSLLRPIAVAPIPSPSIAPQRCLPAPGIRPSPMINPVFRQPLIPARPTNEQGIHQGQLNVRDVSNQQFVACCTAPSSVFTKPILLPSGAVSAAVSAVSPTLQTCIATTSMHTNVQYVEQDKGKEVSKQHIVSCTMSASVCTSSFPSCNEKHAPVSSTTQTCSATTSAHINLHHSKCSEAFKMDALSVSACSTKICEPTITTVTNTKPFEANNLPPSRNVNKCEASSVSNVKPLLSVSLPQSSGTNTYETESLSTTEQLRTSSLPQNCNTDKTEVHKLLRPKESESSSLLEVCDIVECKADCSPMNTCKEQHVQTAPLPAGWNAVECQDDSHFTQKELQTAAVSVSSDIVRNPAVMSDRDILHAKPWSPLGFQSGEDCRKSLETRLGSPVTGSVWPDTLVKDSDHLASFGSEDSPLGWVDSEADALVKSVRSIVDVERPSSKKTEVDSWLNNAASQDKVWMKPADVKNIWSSSADSVCDLYSNVCRVSSTEQKHSVMGVGGPMDSDTVDQYDASGTETDQWTNTTEIGLHSQHGIWPTAFGPFAMPSELESPPDGTCRLPPGLETQVMARFGAIGERGPQMQRQNADVEGSDSGLELASGSSSELSVALLSSETVVSAVASVRGQPIDPLQKPSATDSSMLLDTSQLVDVISARMAQIVRQGMNDSMLPENSDGEFQALRHHPCSVSCMPTSTSEDDSCLTQAGSYSNIDSILRQPATTLCDTGTSQPASDTTEQSVFTDNAVAQLLDILRKPQLLREVLNFVNSSSSASASRSMSCSSQDAEASCKIATSGVVSSSTTPLTSDDPASGNTSVANSQDETGITDEETDVSGANSCSTFYGAVVLDTCSSPTHLQTCSKCNASVVSGNVSQDESSIVDKETDVSLPVSGTNTSNISSGTVASMSSSSPSYLQAHMKCTASVMSDNTNDANSQRESRLVKTVAGLSVRHDDSSLADKEDDILLVSGANISDANYTICSSSTAGPDRHLHDALSVQLSTPSWSYCTRDRKQALCGALPVVCKVAQDHGQEPDMSSSEAASVSAVAESRVKSLTNAVDKRTENCASDSPMDDLLVLLDRWKL